MKGRDAYSSLLGAASSTGYRPKYWRQHLSVAMTSQRRNGWGMVALVVGGYFLHDFVLHLGLLTVPWLIEYEFGLPNLSILGINPETTSQLEGFVFSLAATLILIPLGFRLLRTKQ